MTDLRTTRRRRTRQDILETAWELAETSGIAGVSLRDLASRVGMRAPSLYTYFPSKDAIYDAMFAEGFDALDEHMAGVLDRVRGDDRLGRLTAAAEEFVAFCQASPARYALMFTRAVPGWEPSPEAYAHSLRSYQRTETALQQLGIDTPDTRDLYIAVIAGLAAQQMANEPKGDRWRRLSRDAMEMLVARLDRAEEEAK